MKEIMTVLEMSALEMKKYSSRVNLPSLLNAFLVDFVEFFGVKKGKVF